MEAATLMRPAVVRRRRAIGQRLNELCTMRAVPIGEAARRMGVHRSTWWRWQTGQTSVPAELMPVIAWRFRTSVAWLYGSDALEDIGMGLVGPTNGVTP